MIEKFNSIFYLILFSIHFLGLGFYAYQMIIDNKRYREKFQIDETAIYSGTQADYGSDDAGFIWFGVMPLIIGWGIYLIRKK